MPSVPTWAGFLASVTNETGIPVTITTVTVGQSYPGGADEPELNYPMPGGAVLREPRPHVLLRQHVQHRPGGGRPAIHPVSIPTFEAGSCAAGFQEGQS